MAITAAMRTQVVQLYAALFGRAPEADGLGYWVQQLNSGKTFAQIAQSMYSVDAARAYYPSFYTNEEIVLKFYKNVLGRDADAAGKDYWLGKLNAAGATPGAVIADMINAVVAYHDTDADALKSQALFNNKVAVGEYYAVTLVGNDVTFAKTLFTGLTDDAATVTAKKAAADGAVNPPPVGQTLTLTTSATDVSTGGGADDTIIGQWGQSTTLQASDKINGGAGNDTLRIVTDVIPGQATAATVGGFTVTNVETLEVQAQNANGTTLGLENVAGVTTIRSSASNAALTLENVKAIATLEIANALNASDLTVKYATAVVSGSSDTQNLTLNGNDTGKLDIAGIETLAVTTATANSKIGSIVDTSLTKITVAGDKALTVTAALPNTVTTFDASAQTAGGVTIIAGTGAVAVTGGAGADKVTYNAGEFTSADSYNGGAGRDTIVVAVADLTASSYAASAKISNVETIQLSTKLTVDFDASKIAGEDTFVLAEGFTGPVTISAAADASTLSVLKASTGVLTYTIGSGATLATATGTANTLNLTVGTSGTNLAADFGEIAAAGVETLTLASNGSATAGGANTLKVTDADATKLTISGNEDLVLTMTGAALSTLDASTATGALDLSAVTYKASTAATITGGSGADKINGSAAADSIVGGAGNDIISGGNGADTMTGGAGVDTFSYGAVAESSGATVDVITDFVSGTDLINLQNLANATGRTTIELKNGAAADFGSAQSAIALNSGKTQVVFQADTGTLWVDVNDDGTLNNNDLQVKLTGVTKVVAADIGGTANPGGTGNYLTLTAAPANVDASTQTNATAKATEFADTISTTAANLANSTVNGAGGSDTLNITDSIGAFTLVTAAGAGTATVSNVEVINLGGGSSAKVTMPNTANLTINNSSSSSAATVQLGTAAQTYNGNGAIDTVTLTAVGQTVKTGAGNDVISGATVAFLATATLDGGAGTDVLTIADGETITNTTFSGTNTSISNIETLNLGVVANAAQAVTLFDGLKTLTVDTSTSAVNIGVTSTAARLGALTSLQNLNANAAADTISLTVSDAATSLDLTNLVVANASQGVSLVLGNFTNNVTLNAAQFNAGATTTIATVTGGSGTDTLTLTDVATTTFTATATSAPASIENITLGGTTATNYVDTDASARTITGNSANNTVTIAVAGAAKTVNLSSGGSDTIKVDSLGTATAAVTVQGFQVGATASGGDILNISYGAGSAGTLSIITGTTGNLANGGAVAAISGVNALSNAIFQVNGSFSDAAVKSALINGFANGSVALGHTNNEFYYVALDNGTDTAIYRFSAVDNGGAAGKLDSAADITVLQQVVVLTGIADVGTLTSANFV